MVRFQLIAILGAAAGLLDTAIFLFTKWDSIKANKARARGTIAIWWLWLILVAATALNATSVSIALSALLLLAGLVLLYVHLKHKVATWRVYIAPVAAAIALLASLAR
jgi:hypothetical protein